MKVLGPLLVLALLVVHVCLCDDTFNYDIVIYGATPAGVAAALSAAWHNATLRIALIEPTANLGGMCVAGGIGLRDLSNETTFVNTIGWKWAMLNAKDYGVSYPVYQPDIYIMEKNLNLLLSQEPNIHVIVNTSLLEVGGVVVVGTTITSIVTKGPTGEVTRSASMFIDASYEGDLARWAGVNYTYGRESKAQYNEEYAGVRPYSSASNFLSKAPVLATVDEKNSTLLPYIDTVGLKSTGEADDRMMGYSYRLCITPTKSKQTPFFAPLNYNRNDFILLERYVQSLVASGVHPNGPGLGDMVDILIYRNYPPHDKFDMCDSYAAFTSDAINLNRGYVEGTYAERQTIAQRTLYYVLGLVYFLATDYSVPNYTRNNTKSYGLCNDQWPTNNHIPPQMYVREGLRIIGDYVLNQNEIIGAQFINDSIAIGSWFYDIHVVSRTAVKGPNNTLIANNEGNIVANINGHGTTYEIPVGVLFPKRSQLTNLIVPVCHSASHVAYASTRVEPTFIVLGESSGLIAAVNVGSSQVVAQNVDVSLVQSLLKKRGIAIHVQG